ncbi:MAG TPA: DedA family protein [Chloroflexota bacterium]|jgi:membrane protein DedA with SNARE-associated domain
MDWWTSLGSTVERFVEQYGLVAAFVLITVEEAGIPSPIPADVLVLLASLQARQGRISLWELLAVAEAATVLGASILYFLARWAGRDLVYRYGRYVHLSPERLDRIEARLRRGGVWTVALGRIFPGLRVLTAVACGIFEVPYRVFLPGMAVGAFAYILIFAFLGYVLGPPIVAFLESIQLPLSSLLSLALLGVLLGLLGRARRALPTEVVPSGGRGRFRAGLLAGAVAAVSAALALNVLFGLLGALAAIAPSLLTEETLRRFPGEERRLLPFLVGIVVFVLVGAAWGGVYGRWGEPIARHLTRTDALRGIAFALVLWGLALWALAPNLDLTTAETLVFTAVQSAQHLTYGAVLGLAYPLFLAQIAGSIEDEREPPEAATR